MSTYYTSKYSGEQIDEAVRKILDGEMTGDYADRQLSNLDTPQGALANPGAGVRPSLLVNGDFRAGHVVNQRGQTSYTGITPTVDMWSSISSSLTVTVQDEGISISGQGYDYYREYLENPERFNGKTLTVSALVKNPNGQFRLNLYNETKNDQNIGNIPASSDWTLVTKTVDNFSVADGDKVAVLLYPGGGVPGQTVTAQVAATKLEEGSTQTLAYQDEDGAWQLLPQPESDYATQLAKCQRYQLRLPYGSSQNYAPIGFGWAQTASSIRIIIPTPVTMRANPVISYLSGDISGISLICNGKSVVPTAISHIAVQNYGVAIEFAVSDATANMPCVMRMTNAYMMLDANL